MSTNGRKRMPHAMKLMRGTVRPYKASHNDREPEARGALGEPPPGMTEAQRAIWRYHVKHAPRNVLFRIDAEVMKGLVIAIDQRDRAQEQLNAEDQVIETAAGAIVVNPLLRIVERQTMLILRSCAELGFSPTARARIVAGDDGAKDPADEFLEAANEPGAAAAG